MVTLRPMRIEDLGLVERWLGEPHVARWYLAGSSLETELEDIRQSLTGAQAVHLLVVLHDSQPIGWCQWYPCDVDLAWAADIGAEPGDCGIDYAIGDETRVGVGVGSDLIAVLVRLVQSARPGCRIIANPDVQNRASRRVLEKNGFDLIGVKAMASEPTDEPMAIYRLPTSGHGSMGSAQQPPERRMVGCADGAALAAWTVGPVDGPPVVLASGGGADHRGWRSVVPEICESDAERALWAPHGASLAERCRVVVFDQRGTGESLQVPPADSARLLGSDLATACGSLLTTPCCVVGHSMGGMAAMHAALDFPQCVSALGLVATTAGGSGLTLPSDAYLAAAVARYESGQDEPPDDLELAVAARFRSENRTLYEAFSKETMTQPRTVGPEELAQVLFNHDVSQRLGDITVPTVVICGTEDHVHPLPNSSFLARHIPAARLVEIGGAGHLLNVEASERLIDEIFALVGSV